MVGDRWTLLIVRELLIRGPSRYTDLLKGLPGIATNLLSSRLKDLEEAGVVTREDAPPPISASLVCLTERGEALGPAVRALGIWGAPLLAGSRRSDAFRPHWLAMPAEIYLVDHNPDKGPVSVELRVGDEPVTIESVDGQVKARPGRAESPDLVLLGTREAVFGLVMGKFELNEAKKAGMKHIGDLEVLKRLHPPSRSNV